MTKEAFARLKIDALLAAKGWDTLDTNAVRFEVQLRHGTRADYVQQPDASYACPCHGNAVNATSPAKESLTV
jgi:hypothetical protein